MNKKRTSSLNGIPESLNIENIADWVKSRVSSKRFKHIEGVVKQGEILSFHYNTTATPVVLACWLHDSCKEIKAKELVQLAIDFNIPLEAMDKQNGHILHGPVAAEVVKEQFKIENKDVLSAIAEHTLGGIDMCDVSKIVYLADTLEESRPISLRGPIWKALTGDTTPLNMTKMNVNLNLNNAIYVASNMVLSHLLETGKPIHPKTVRVRNHFLDLISTENK